MICITLWGRDGTISERDVCSSTDLAFRSIRTFLDRGLEQGAMLSVHCDGDGVLPHPLKALCARAEITA